MYSYTAYGLGIHSALPLPELRPADAPPQVFIRLDEPSLARPANGETRGDAEELHVSWNGVGQFDIRRGREIVIRPAAGAEERVLRLFALGPALALVLHQRGFLVLHASAAADEQGVAVFLGACGQGKSTMAAALHARGFRMVADDLVPLDLTIPGPPRVSPGFPRFKLWPDAAAMLGHDPQAMPKLHPELDKRDHRVDRDFLPAPAPLRAIYVLDEGNDIAIVSLNRQQAFAELVRHSYAAQLLPMTKAVARHFRQCGQLAGRVPVYRLARPRCLDRLGEVARRVGEHLKN